MDQSMTYAEQCAYTIRHSLKLEEFSRSKGPHEINTKQKAWTSIARLISGEKLKGRTVAVLFAPAEETTWIVAAADLVSVQTRDFNSFRFDNFRYLEPPIRKTTLKLASGKNLSRDFIRDYAICMTPPGLANHPSRPLMKKNGEIADELKKILSDPSIPETTRMALIEARLGQGRFRSALIERWRQGCAVTGCTVLDVLRASHIKPWHASSPEERLDPANGILLSANFDALFDSGLISFDDRGRMIVSAQISAAATKGGVHLLGLPSSASLFALSLRPALSGELCRRPCARPRQRGDRIGFRRETRRRIKTTR
jgi:hypothetical protein